MSMKRKKKATEAEAVGFSMDVPGIVLARELLNHEEKYMDNSWLYTLE